MAMHFGAPLVHLSLLNDVTGSARGSMVNVVCLVYVRVGKHRS
jgi:hypothetical protein